MTDKTHAQPPYHDTHIHVDTFRNTKRGHACCDAALETAAAVGVLVCEIKPGGSVIQQGSEVPIN